MLMMTLLPAHVSTFDFCCLTRLTNSLVRAAHHRWTRHQTASHPQVFPALRALIVQYFTSADLIHHRGAVLSLGICVEGASEYITPLMNGVWPIIETDLQDFDASVRKATCIAVSCLYKWLEDECASKHAALVPVRVFFSSSYIYSS